MIEGTKPLNSKTNTIQEFTVQFCADSVSIDNTLLPLGQISTDVLNISDATLFDLREKNLALMTAVEQQLWNPDIKKDAALAIAVQDKMNSALDVVFTLPLYRHIDIDKGYANNFLSLMIKKQPDAFLRLCDPESMEASIFTGLLRTFLSVFDETVTFRTYISIMLDIFFERLKKRDSEYYAIGIYDFFRNEQIQREIAQSLPDHTNFMFLQSRSAMIEYTTMPNPKNAKQYMIAERMVFHSIGAFLHVDFFRGLMHGNAPRRCHNCGRFFLLTEGYDTRYCNNIAPGESVRTCRKVGAHRKESQKNSSSMIQAEYSKVYSRLKTRRYRGKISYDEWNKQIALTQEYKDQAEKGKLSEFDLKQLYEKM